jgi:hypothetical protein
MICSVIRRGFPDVAPSERLARSNAAAVLIPVRFPDRNSSVRAGCRNALAPAGDSAAPGDLSARSAIIGRTLVAPIPSARIVTLRGRHTAINGAERDRR